MAVLIQSKPSSHWYTPEGEAMHEIKCKTREGNRPTHLGDAKKLGLYPSVTGILKVLAKPALENWKMKQVAETALRYTPPKGESPTRSANVVISQAMQQVNVSADIGTRIHNAISEYLIDETPIPISLQPYCNRAIEYILSLPTRDKWESEKILVNKEVGFAGTGDLFNTLKSGQRIVADFKTRKTKPEYKVIEHRDFEPTQISAYGRTMWPDPEERIVGLNVYISTTEAGRTAVAKYSPDRIDTEWAIFQMASCVWRYMNKYDPRQKKFSKIPEAIHEEISKPFKIEKPEHDEESIYAFCVHQRTLNGRVTSWAEVREMLVDALGGENNPDAVNGANVKIEEFKKKIQKEK